MDNSKSEARAKRLTELARIAENNATAKAKPINQPSKAPPPLESIRSSGGYVSRASAAKPIDWEYWRLMDEVKLYEAVALSLGENPELFDVDDPSEEFERRLNIAVSNARAGRLQLVLLYNNERVSPVLLANFVAWAKGLNLPNMPPEFLALAESCTIERQTKEVGSALTSDGVTTPTTGRKWTPERLAELKDYRDSHTMPQTAVKFGISEQRIRQLLPTKRPRATPFAGLVHRSE